MVPSSTHGNGLRWRAVERLSQVAVLDPGQMLDQAEQVGAGRRHRPPQVVLAQPHQLRQHALAGEPELAMQFVLDAVRGRVPVHRQMVAQRPG